VLAQLLPSGAALPPVPYLLAVVVAVLAVGGALYRRAPPVTPSVVVGFAPWMIAGAAGYALYQAGAVPAVVAPLFGNPVVYATTFAVAGTVWLVAADRAPNGRGIDTVPGVLALSGGVVAAALVAVGVAGALAAGRLSLAWPLAGLALSVGLAAVIWFAVRERVAATGTLGALALFGHTLDGVSTAVGMRLGFGEQTPLSALLIEMGAELPPAEMFGAAWLFVLVKLVVAVLVLFAFRDYVREEPAEGSLLLGAVAAVGLGPGAHNIVLFAIA